MLTLVIFNLLLLIIIAALLLLVKITVKSKRGEQMLFLVSAAVTIIFHYSSLIYRFLTGGEALEYLAETPNLLLPIYPCNVVMWACLVLALLRNTDSPLGRLLTDYIFWFGIFSTLVGMFANVDFINNPTLKDYEITKSIVAHATLLFNLLQLPLFGKVRIDFFRNMKSMVISVVMMYAIGLYCNLVFKVLVSPEEAYDVNSMFIIHSPFEGVEFLKYPIIALTALLLYSILFTVLELIKRERGERWFDRVRVKLNRKKP